MENNIRTLRVAKGLSQTELAEMIGTSQQQIQRIEAGRQAIRLDLALGVAEALGQRLERIFPAAADALEGRRMTSSADREWAIQGRREELEASGIEPGNGVWWIQPRLRCGAEPLLLVDKAEWDRLFSCLQDNPQQCDSPMLGLRTRTHEVVINRSHIVSCEMGFDVGDQDYQIDLSDSAVQVWTTGSPEPVKIDVKPDDVRGEDLEPIAGRLFDLVSGSIYPGMISFQDLEGDYKWVNQDDLELLAVHYRFLDGNFYDEEDEEANDG